MLAEIWHWWIGIVLTLVSVLLALQLVVGYVRKVVSPQYPTKRNREE